MSGSHRLDQLDPANAAPPPATHTKRILVLMADSSSFPSGIPDPPIFSKLGHKDRSYLRKNIEAIHAANMTTEQTYV